MSFNHRASKMNKKSLNMRGFSRDTSKVKPEVKVEKTPFAFRSKAEERRSLEKFLKRLGLI